MVLQPALGAHSGSVCSPRVFLNVSWYPLSRREALGSGCGLHRAAHFTIKGNKNRGFSDKGRNLGALAIFAPLQDTKDV